MLDIRKLLLSTHERFMLLSTNQETDALTDEVMKATVESIGEPYTDALKKMHVQCIEKVTTMTTPQFLDKGIF